MRGSSISSVQALSNWSCFGGIPHATQASSRVTKVDAPAGSFYLKECPSIDCVQREMELLGFLSGAGLPVPCHIPSTSGLPYASEGGNVFWLSHELPGRHFAQFEGAAGLHNVECLGVTLGRLHQVLVNAPNPDPFPIFDASAEELIGNMLARATPFDVRRLEQLCLKIVSVRGLPQQLIHRDPHRLNMLFSNRALTGYLDFDLVHQGPRLFDLCYCASGVLSESFSISGYPAYWLQIVERIFRAYGRMVELSTEERLAAWSMLVTIELIFMGYCLDGGNIDAALMHERMLFWYDEHQLEIEAAMAA
jgi:Ser/Thr protein kinase RdoA (MazF antagonist)